MNLQELETPALVLDRLRMARNIARLRDRLAPSGVTLRPHVKTNKSADVTASIGAPGTPITVSTLKEAGYFLEHGWRDILYAVGIVPSKLPHVAELVRRGAHLTLLLDNVEAAQALAAWCREHGLTVPVLIEIDTDGHRSGVKPEDASLLDIAAALGFEDGRGAWLAGKRRADCRPSLCQLPVCVGTDLRMGIQGRRPLAQTDAQGAVHHQ